MAFSDHFQKQNVMRNVIRALVPAFIGSVYFFGWYSAFVMLLSIGSCVITEWLFVRKSPAGKVSEAVLVTAVLYALILPPTIPWPMVILGAVFGITFGKMAFGGFGANVFNPAMVGRAFVYITFPVHMTNRWIPAANFSEFPGGFGAWQFSSFGEEISSITAATASHAAKAHASTLPGTLQLILGNINGQFHALGEVTLIGGGSLGETSAVLLIIGGLYLVVKKIANWRLIIGFFVVYIVFQTVMHWLLPVSVFNPLFALFSGGALLGGFFMVTDPVSAPKTRPAQWIYAALIAIFAILIRSFSLFAGGLMFAILLGNMFGPIIDSTVRSIQKRKGP